MTDDDWGVRVFIEVVPFVRFHWVRSGEKTRAKERLARARGEKLDPLLESDLQCNLQTQVRSRIAPASWFSKNSNSQFIFAILRLLAHWYI